MGIKLILKNLHRFAGLFISLQVILWAISGTFMYFWDRSDLYQAPHQYALDIQALQISQQELATQIKQQQPQAVIQEIKVFQRLKQGYFAVKLSQPSQTLIFDQRGQKVVQFNPTDIKQIALDNYSGSGQLKEVKLLPKSTGNYFSSQPIYLATFDDPQANELYFSPQTGQLLARRNGTWGLYNTFWEIHLMKYFPLKVLNSGLLLLICGLTLLVVLSGVYKFFQPYWHLFRKKTL